jgi:hypothetical protein
VEGSPPPDTIPYSRAEVAFTVYALDGKVASKKTLKLSTAGRYGIGYSRAALSLVSN